MGFIEKIKDMFSNLLKNLNKIKSEDNNISEITSIEAKFYLAFLEQDNSSLTEEEINTFVDIFNGYVEGVLTPDDLVKAIKITSKLYRNLYFDDKLNEKQPSIQLSELEAGTLGAYQRASNSIGLSLSEIEKINNNRTENKYQGLWDIIDKKSKDVDPFVNLCSTVGHEYAHYIQKVAVDEYDAMTDEERQKLPYEKLKLILSFKNDKQISQEKLEGVIKYVHQYQDNDEQVKSIASSLSFYSYFQQLIEINARNVQSNFFKKVYEMLIMHPNSSDNLIRFCLEQMAKQNYFEQGNSKVLSNGKQAWGKLILGKGKLPEGLKIRGEDLALYGLVYDEEIEKNAKLQDIAYSEYLELLIKDRPYEEKQEILFTGLVKGYKELAEASMKCISKDAVFVKGGELLQEQIVDHLTEKEIIEVNGDKPQEVSEDVYWYDYSKILNQMQIKKIASKLISQNKFEKAIAIAQSSNQSEELFTIKETIKVAKEKEKKYIEERNSSAEKTINYNMFVMAILTGSLERKVEIIKEAIEAGLTEFVEKAKDLLKRYDPDYERSKKIVDEEIAKAEAEYLASQSMS